MDGAERTDGRRAAATAPLLTSGHAESIAEQIARAQRLVESSLAQLRESFLALADISPAALDTEPGRYHFERAVIALQSEDTVGQLLALTRQRAEDLERSLAQARTLIGEIVPGPDHLRAPQAAQACCDTRLAALCAVLNLPEAGLSPTVKQSSVAPGAMQLFDEEHP